MGGALPPGLERSCGPSPGDWIQAAPSAPGIHRIEAAFAGHAYDPHRHDTYAIGITLGGVQTFDYRGARADSLPGNVLVLHPDERHNGRAGADSGFRYRMLYIEPHLIRDALGGGTLPFMRTAVSADPRLVRALRPALEEWSRNWGALETDQVVLALAEALGALDARSRPAPAPRACLAAVEKARQCLRENLERGVTSEELEAVTGVDRYTLARQFRAQLGTSPYRYLTMRRLERAADRIAQGSTLAEAAAASGFADQSHMTRQFGRTYGMPPGRWRRLRAGDRSQSG